MLTHAIYFFPVKSEELRSQLRARKTGVEIKLGADIRM